MKNYIAIDSDNFHIIIKYCFDTSALFPVVLEISIIGSQIIFMQ